jgi:hypothetical protein
MIELPITFSPILPSNFQQLKSLNTVIFPIKYEDKMYTDMIACGEVTQLAYHNGKLIGAIGCRLENKGAEVCQGERERDFNTRAPPYSPPNLNHPSNSTHRE